MRRIVPLYDVTIKHLAAFFSFSSTKKIKKKKKRKRKTKLIQNISKFLLSDSLLKATMQILVIYMCKQAYAQCTSTSSGQCEILMEQIATGEIILHRFVSIRWIVVNNIRVVTFVWSWRRGTILLLCFFFFWFFVLAKEKLKRTCMINLFVSFDFTDNMYRWFP